MISCTEFIPLYSEFFKYLESKGGHDAVVEYWHVITERGVGNPTNPNSLRYKCDRLGGYEGARAYWEHTLTEEACDLLKVFDTKKQYVYTHMRHCPSRGMLNKLSHIEPYYDYCGHCCVIYQEVLKKYGIVYTHDNSGIENAECRSILYREGECPDIDWHNITDEEARNMSGEGVEILDMSSEDNKYLHRDFHLSGDRALKYCSEKFGRAAACEFLATYAKNYYAPKIKEFRERGLAAIKEWIESVYEVEEASELLHTHLSDDRLKITVDKSPVIEYMHSLGQKPSDCYIEETRVLYAVIAEESGFDFKLHYYNEDGATEFEFIRRQ